MLTQRALSRFLLVAASALLIVLVTHRGNATAQVVDSVPPTPPREVNCRAITNTSVECFWFPSRDNVGVTYRIYRAQVLTWLGGLPLTWTTQTLMGTSTVDGLGRRAFLDTGLTAATDYTYWVSSVDPAGNESALSGGAHASPTTPSTGTTIDTQVSFPSSVAPNANITVTQTITCSPACTIGHHDVHWGTTMNSLPNQPGLSAGTNTPATTHVNSVTFTSTLGNVYFMEDGHLGGTGYPANGGGNQPHKEGMLFRVIVTNGNPLTINPATLPNGTPNTAYSQTLTATGEGSGVNSWGVREARLPPGLTLSSAGVLSGTPTTPGIYTFSVMVEDSQGTTAFRSYTLTVEGAPAAQILIQEDFEDDNLASRGWYDVVLWGIEQFISTTERVSGNASLEVRYQAGSTGPWMRHQFAGQDRIYSRYYRKWAANWVWPTSSGPHDTYLFAMYGQPYFPPTDTYLTVYTDARYQGAPAWQVGTVGLLTRRILQGESYRALTSLNPPPPPFQLNRWYCIETLATMNTPGQSNGRVQLWLDGMLIFDVTGLLLRDSNNPNLQFDLFMFGPYFHDGTPQVQSTWMDALVVATDRVGCLGDAVAPSPPTNLIVR